MPGSATPIGTSPGESAGSCGAATAATTVASVGQISTPLGRPVDPDVWMTYAGSPMVAAAATGDRTAVSGASSSRTARSANRAACAPVVRTRAGSASARSAAVRVSGAPGSRGQHAAPDSRTPRIAVTASMPRVCPTPCSRRRVRGLP
ncbi:hypothetical protein ASE41_13860 [Streptomyces sp. Root264]|nr:hypothetical protein ASE41_13860 [Streptomyces sp. Root264]